MSLLCLLNSCEIWFYLFPERDIVLNHLTSCTIQFFPDSIVTMKNGLITKYDSTSNEVTFITKLLSGEFNTYRVFPPIVTKFTSLDCIYSL